MNWTRFGSMEFMSLDFERHSNVFTQIGNYYIREFSVHTVNAFYNSICKILLFLRFYPKHCFQRKMELDMTSPHFICRSRSNISFHSIKWVHRLRHCALIFRFSADEFITMSKLKWVSLMLNFSNILIDKKI